MRPEKASITAEYLGRLKASPFFIVVDYRGLHVGHFNELRKRLVTAGAQIHVVKNSLFRLAAKESGAGDLADSLSGQLAVVSGQKDISAAAKTLKTFRAEFEKPQLRFGCLGNQRLDSAGLLALADLPSLDVLRSTLLGVILEPASRLVRLINTPGSQLARVIKAKSEKAPA